MFVHFKTLIRTHTATAKHTPAVSGTYTVPSRRGYPNAIQKYNIFLSQKKKTARGGLEIPIKKVIPPEQKRQQRSEELV